MLEATNLIVISFWCCLLRWTGISTMVTKEVIDGCTFSFLMEEDEMLASEAFIGRKKGCFKNLQGVVVPRLQMVVHYNVGLVAKISCLCISVAIANYDTTKLATNKSFAARNTNHNVRKVVRISILFWLTKQMKKDQMELFLD